MSKLILRVMCVLVPMFFVTTGQAAEARSYGPAVTLAVAKKVAAGAIAHAKKNGWNVAVAIVDKHGFLVYYERLDDTQTASAAVAVDKARTAAMYRRPSRVFENVVVKKGRTAVMTLRGVTAIIGGLPIKVGGKVIGGVGVSGVASVQDEMAAQAGLDTLK
jgi:glc operon protein GlcG